MWSQVRWELWTKIQQGKETEGSGGVISGDDLLRAEWGAEGSCATISAACPREVEQKRICDFKFSNHHTMKLKRNKFNLFNPIYTKIVLFWHVIDIKHFNEILYGFFSIKIHQTPVCILLLQHISKSASHMCRTGASFRGGCHLQAGPSHGPPHTRPDMLPTDWKLRQGVLMGPGVLYMCLLLLKLL